MKIGLQIPDYTWGNSQALSPTLLRIARVAEEAGFELIGVPDHLWQVSPWVGPVEHEMLECYTTLAFLAGNTSRINLMAMVTGSHFRHPSLLAKIVTTLDVLSAGRAWLGIGAGYYEEEARGLGIALPPWRNASSGSRRPCRSACACGQAITATTSRSRGATSGWSGCSTRRRR